jgi:alpha-2-macroglobulin
MRKAVNYLLLCVILCALLGGLNSCEKKIVSNIPAPPRKLEKLEVVMALPIGKVEEQEDLDTITVSFNQPMAPLTTVPKDDSSGPLTFNPPLHGKYRWKGTSTLAFTPANPLPPGITIKATVPSGTKSLFGALLEKEYAWDFETLRPALKDSLPRNDTHYVMVESPLFLYFNMPMDPAKAQNFIRLIGINGKGEKFPTEFSVKSATEKDIPEKKNENYEKKWKIENVLMITTAKPLERGWKYRVEIPSGLRGKEGELGSEKEEKFTFSTQNRFAFINKRASSSQNPSDYLYFYFTNPVYMKDLAKNVTFSPAVKIPEYYNDYGYETAEPSLYLKLRPQTQYSVSLSKNLKDIFGNALPKDETFTFKTTDFAPQISMSGGSGIIEAHSKHLLPLSFLNIGEVGLQMALVNKDSIVPMLTGDAMSYGTRYSPGGAFFKVDRKWEVKTPWNEERFLPLDLNQVLGRDDTGIVFVQVDTNRKKDDSLPAYLKAFVQVTNLGVTGKFSPENNLVWVTTLDTAQPVKDAAVELRDEGNKVVWKGTTNEKGCVETPGWLELGLSKKNRWEKPTIWVIVSSGSDIAFINSSWGWGIDPWVFNIDHSWNTSGKEVGGSLFTERGLYKPGEDVKIKGIFREKKRGKWKLSAMKTTLKIFNSRNEKVLIEQVKLSDYGSFDRSFKLDEKAPTGEYRIELLCNLPGQENYSACSDTFRVEEYEPVDFKVSVDSTKPSYVFQDTFKGSIKGWYLFGAPMSGDKVSWKFRLSPYRFTPKDCDDYLFGPMYFEDRYRYRDEEDSSSDQVTLLGTGDGVLGRDGRVEVSVPLKMKTIQSSAMLSVEASIKTVNRVELSNTGNYVVHKGDYYIGLRPASTFVTAKNPQNIQVVAVTPEGRKVPGEAIKIELYQRVWHSVRKVGISGTREWVTEKKDELVKTFDVKSKNEPLSLEYTPDKAGYYVIKAQGVDRKQNLIVTEAGFYASGQDYVPWARGEDDVIELVKDKNQYKPGDKCRIIVKSPYEKAKALVTFEREYVIDRMVVDLKGSADVVEFPIKSDDLPNIFVSVVLIQGRVAEEKFSDFGEDLGKPSFKIGYVNIPVASEEKKLKVSVKPDRERYKPGDNVTVNLKLQDSKGRPVEGEICLAAVDVGVLSLINFKTPNYYESFYGSRSLSVTSSESRLHVIGQRDYGEKGDNSGGGGADLAAIAMRTDFKSTPYWNPSIITDKQGNATVNFKLPDNLTTFRLMAVCQTKDASFGSSDSEFTVAKPLLMKPSSPRFARIRDSFQAGVTIFNGTSQGGEVTVQLDCKGIQLAGEATKKVTIPAGQEKEVLFAFKADTIGKAHLEFKAALGPETDGLVCEFPVVKPILTEATATSGSTDKDRSLQQLSLPKNIDPVAGGLYLGASSTALTGLEGGIDYLVTYPHECLEQKCSKILPAIVAQDLVESFNLSANLKGKAYRDFIQGYLNIFWKYQKASGGFGFWEDSENDHDYLSCYAMYTMAMAKRQGYKVDQKVVAKGCDNLRNLLSRSEKEWRYYYNEQTILTIKSFALYDLYLWGKGDASYLSLLYEKNEKMCLFGQALLLQSLHMYGKDKDREKAMSQLFMNKMKGNPTSNHFEEPRSTYFEWIFNSNVRTTALILQTLLEVKAECLDADSAGKIAKWLVEAQKNGRWNTTQENVFAFNALTTYFKRYESVTPNYTLKVFLDRTEVMKEVFKGRQLTVRTKEVAMKDLKPGSDIPVTFEKKGKGRFYYTMRFKYASLDKVEPKDEGMAIFKIIEPVDQVNNGEALKAGAVYKVTVSVVTPQERMYVVVEDPLPAGFVVVNTAFATEKGELLRKLEKARRKETKGLWGGTFNHFETYNDRVLLFGDVLSPGEHRFTYFVRAMYFGTYNLPASKVEMMYEPEVYGISDQKSVEIK